MWLNTGLLILRLSVEPHRDDHSANDSKFHLRKVVHDNRCHSHVRERSVLGIKTLRKANYPFTQPIIFLLDIYFCVDGYINRSSTRLLSPLVRTCCSDLEDVREPSAACNSTTRWTMGMSRSFSLKTQMSPIATVGLFRERNNKSPRKYAGSMLPLTVSA